MIFAFCRAALPAGGQPSRIDDVLADGPKLDVLEVLCLFFFTRLMLRFGLKTNRNKIRLKSFQVRRRKGSNKLSWSCQTVQVELRSFIHSRGSVGGVKGIEGGEEGQRICFSFLSLLWCYFWWRRSKAHDDTEAPGSPPPPLHLFLRFSSNSHFSFSRPPFATPPIFTPPSRPPFPPLSPLATSPLRLQLLSLLCSESRCLISCLERTRSPAGDRGLMGLEHQRERGTESESEKVLTQGRPLEDCEATSAGEPRISSCCDELLCFFCLNYLFFLQDSDTSGVLVPSSSPWRDLEKPFSLRGSEAWGGTSKHGHGPEHTAMITWIK